MARPRRDGSPSRTVNKRVLTELFVRRVRAQPAAFNVWDDRQGGLVLRVHPTGQRSWKAVYRFHSRPRWFHLGDASAIGLADARRLAARVMLQAVEGRD